MKNFSLFYHEYWREIWLFIATFVTILLFAVLFAPDPTPSHLFFFGIVSMVVLLFVSCALVPKNTDDSRWGIFGTCWLLCALLITVNAIIWAYHLQNEQSAGVFVILAGLGGVLIFLFGIVWQTALRQTAANASQNPSQPFDPQMVLRIVQGTDETHPDQRFCRVVPYIHMVPEALEIVNKYGRLSLAYSETLYALHGCQFPTEIEIAVIKLKYNHLIYYLTEEGIQWSKNAQALMRIEHPEAYQQNVLKTQNGMLYLAEQKQGNWLEAEKIVGVSELNRFERLGYVRRTGNQWKMTTSGFKQAEFYSKPTEEAQGLTVEA